MWRTGEVAELKANGERGVKIRKNCIPRFAFVFFRKLCTTGKNDGGLGVAELKVGS